MLKKKKSKDDEIFEEEKDVTHQKEPRDTLDSQTGNSSRIEKDMNDSFITFGRPSFCGEEVGTMDDLNKEQG